VLYFEMRELVVEHGFTRKLHRPGCRHAAAIPDHDRWEHAAGTQVVTSDHLGVNVCRVCKPDVVPVANPREPS
jgi:hypothetical protein